MPVLAIDWSCYPVMYFVDPTAQFELKSINIQDLDYCVVQEPGGTQRRTSWQDFQKLERERHKYAYGYRPYLPYLDFNLAEGAKKPLAVLVCSCDYVHATETDASSCYADEPF